MLLARPSAVFRALRGDSARAVPPVVITTGPHPGEALLDEVLIQAVAAGRPFALALLRLVDLTDGEAAATSLSLANATDVTTELVNAVLGPGERVVRRGPYEVAVLLHAGGSALARRMLERLRHAVEETAWQVGEITVGVAVGAAVWNPASGRQPDDVLAAAEAAVDRSQGQGRWDVVIAGADREPGVTPPCGALTSTDLVHVYGAGADVRRQLEEEAHRLGLVVVDDEEAVVLVLEDGLVLLDAVAAGWSPGMQRRVLARTTSSGSGSAGVPVPAMDLRVRLETPWLPRLLAERAVTSVLQPIINLESGARVGVEALMRGNLDGEERSALEILEAARAHELLFTMDVVAWTAALDQGLPRLGPDERLHVNLLPTAVDEPDTYLATTQALARRDDLARVVVEIAEADGAETRMSAIADGHRALGARVALDRACGGLRTLRHIDTIRPDMVKLDMGLTLGLTPDDARVAVVRAIVEQARAAGALTVAVGIESAAACLTLRELGVDLGQGYFLGRPQ